MNKTLLLIICDFLLLNLLALTRWDAPIAKPAPQQEQKPISAAPDAPPVTKDQDLVEVMKLSLEDEQTRRNQLAEQLQNARQTLQGAEQDLAAREQELAARAQALAQLETERSRLNTTLDVTRRSAEMLAQEVDAAKRDAGVSRERLAQMQRDLERREADLAREKSQVSKLQEEQAQAREKIETLNVAVKVAEHEKTLLRETAETFKTQAEAERQERIKVQETTTQLAQGVGSLAEKSEDLTKEIRDHRPINANTLYNEFLANNVQVRFETTRAGIFSPVTRSVDARTILVGDGKDTYAIFHVGDTPFVFDQTVTDFTNITVTFIKGAYRATAPSVHFLSVDPRIVVVPVSAEQVAGLGVKVFLTTLDPFKFPDALLISSGGAKYDPSVPFKLDPAQPGFVRMQVSFFSSKRGDLVLGKSGELLGIMISKDYCAIVNNFLPFKTIETGEPKGTGAVFEALAARLRQIPLRLQ